MRISTLLLLAASSTVLFAASPTIQAACDPTVIQSPTKFPLQSQLRGQKGVVLLDVTVDATGRVAATQLVRSSGHKRLDLAASESIRDGWKFDVTSCVRGDLPMNDLIAVEFRNEEFGS